LTSYKRYYNSFFLKICFETESFSDLPHKKARQLLLLERAKLSSLSD